MKTIKRSELVNAVKSVVPEDEAAISVAKTTKEFQTGGGGIGCILEQAYGGVNANHENTYVHLYGYDLDRKIRAIIWSNARSYDAGPVKVIDDA